MEVLESVNGSNNGSPTRNKVTRNTNISIVESQTNIGCINPKMLEVMQTALTMNLLTMLIMMSVLPIQILNIIYENCDNRNGGCVDYLRRTDAMGVLRLLMLLLHPILVMWKIRKIHSITGNQH